MPKSVPEQVYQEAFEACANATPLPSMIRVCEWIAKLAKSIDELDTACAPLKAIETGHEIRIQQLEARSKPQIFLGHVEGSLDGDALESPTVVRKLRDELRSANGRIGRLLARGGELENQNRITQAQLEKFTSACADQSIQIMELRAATDQKLLLGRIAELQAKCLRLEAHRRDDATIERMDRAERGVARLQGHIAETEAMVKKWDAQIDAVTGPHREGETYADAAVRAIKELTRLNNEQQLRINAYNVQFDRLRERVPGERGALLTFQELITDVIEEAETPCPDCKAMAAELEERGECLRVADSDRVPLAMDLAEAKAEIERMRPVCAAAQKLDQVWSGGAALSEDHVKDAALEVTHAAVAYEKACSEAAADDIAF